jgi:N-glycosylase/DNA lyase
LTANTSAEMGIKTQKYIMDGFIEYNSDKLREELKKVKYRFYNKRTDYIVNARFIINDLTGLLSGNNKTYIREYLVNNIKGVGYKEASHFLRNIGVFDFAILDKHIMKILKQYNYIDEIKLSSKNDYLKTEKIFNKIAKSYKLKPGIFDLYLWKIATDKILK